MSYRMSMDKFKRLRKERGMTQEQFAAACGLTQGTVSTHERTLSDPKASTVRAYADALGMSVQDFMDATFVEIDEVA